MRTIPQHLRGRESNRERSRRIAGVTLGLPLRWLPRSTRGVTGPRSRHPGVRPAFKSVGFKNEGQTCYFNSVIQALLHHSGLTGWLYFHHQAQACDQPSDNCASCHLVSLIQKYWVDEQTTAPRSKQREFAKKALMTCIRRDRPPGTIAWHGNNRQQQDAHELYLHIINRMLEAENPSKAYCLDVMARLINLDIEISKKCSSCKHQSTRIESETCLGVSIPAPTGKDPTGPYSLTALIRDQFKQKNNVLQGWRCDQQGCAEKDIGQDVKQKKEIVAPPQMLCVHLQRGYWANGQGRKNMAEVKFQTTLNLTNYMQVEDYLVYELYAIVEHWGSTLNSGHYVTYARDEKYFDMPNKWKLINDATVTERLQLKDVKQGQTNHTPYLLFYTRKQIP